MKKNEQNEFELYLLDFKKTYPYVINHLKCGHTLARKICEGIDFSKGVFFTFLPIDAQIDRMYSFHQGGILPSLEKLETAKYANFWPTPNIDQQLTEFVYTYLLDHYSHKAIFEHVIARASDPHINIQGVDLLIYQDEVYYYFSHNTESPKLIKEIVEETGQAWYFLAVLSSHEIQKQIYEEEWKQVCEHITHIIIGAYDGEGYVYWKKTD